MKINKNIFAIKEKERKWEVTCSVCQRRPEGIKTKIMRFHLPKKDWLVDSRVAVKEGRSSFEVGDGKVLIQSYEISNEPLRHFRSVVQHG